MAGSRSVAWLSALLVAAAVLLALAPLPVAGDIEARAGTLVAPLSGALRDVVRPAADIVLRAGQIAEVTEENASLRRQLARAEADLATLREQGIATEQAAALIKAAGNRADQFTAAAVVLRDPAPGRQMLLLDRGARHGVASGQPVLGAGGVLVGVIVEVDERRSRVRLLSDREFSVAAVVQSSRTPGALTGAGDGLRLEFVETGASVASGDVVLTSALGGRLPRGLLAGKVTMVESSEQDLFETIEVEPLTDFTRIEQVLVMTDFVPGAELTGDEAAPGSNGPLAEAPR